MPKLYLGRNWPKKSNIFGRKQPKRCQSQICYLLSNIQCACFFLACISNICTLTLFHFCNQISTYVWPQFCSVECVVSLHADFVDARDDLNFKDHHVYIICYLYLYVRSSDCKLGYGVFFFGASKLVRHLAKNEHAQGTFV